MSKKVLLSLALACLVLAMVLPQFSLANGEDSSGGDLPPQLPKSCTIRRDPGIPGCPTSDVCNFDTQPNCGICCLISTVYYVTDWIFIFMMLLVVVFTIWGAFEILTSSGGGAEQFKRGQNRILYAVIGFAIAIFSRALPAIVKFILAPGA